MLAETGVAITEPLLVAVVDSLQPGEDGRIQSHYTLVDFTADLQTGKAVTDGAANAVAWADPRDLAPYALWRETLRIIEKAEEIRSLASNHRGL